MLQLLARAEAALAANRLQAAATLATEGLALQAYDDARRAAAFGVIKENIKDGPRPVRLGFVRTTGSGDRRSSWFERRALEAEDRPAMEEIWRGEGQRLREEADAAWDLCSGPVEEERQRAAKALRAVARRARRRVVDAREQSGAA